MKASLLTFYIVLIILKVNVIALFLPIPRLKT